MVSLGKGVDINEWFITWKTVCLSIATVDWQQSEWAENFSGINQWQAFLNLISFYWRTSKGTAIFHRHKVALLLYLLSKFLKSVWVLLFWYYDINIFFFFFFKVDLVTIYSQIMSSFPLVSSNITESCKRSRINWQPEYFFSLKYFTRIINLYGYIMNL